jgi:hypothetical protein
MKLFLQEIVHEEEKGGEFD